MIYGYCRCSTDKQILENQHFEIEFYAKSRGIVIDEWIEETISSRKSLNKRRLNKLLKKLKSQDVLITSELSRLGRSLLEVMSILQYCLERNCQVWTIKEKYRLGSDLQSKVLAFAFGLSAEIERKLISDRTKASLAKIKRDGRKLGRPLGSKSNYLKLERNRTKIHSLLIAGVSKKQIAKNFSVDTSTLYRFLKRYPEVLLRNE